MALRMRDIIIPETKPFLSKEQANRVDKRS